MSRTCWVILTIIVALTVVVLWCVASTSTINPDLDQPVPDPGFWRTEF